MALQGSSLVKVVYILYLVGYVTGGITTIIGLVLAYLGDDDANELEAEHLRFAIRTFWIGLLYSIIAGILVFVAIGFLLIFVVMIWFIVRCVKGLLAIDRGVLPANNVDTWLF